jgi:hypothetical protein
MPTLPIIVPEEWKIVNPNRTSLRNNDFIKSVLYASDQIFVTSNEDDLKQNVKKLYKILHT